MTPTEVAAKLRQFNGWRRDFEDKFEQPDTREVSEAIDAAVEMIEHLESDAESLAMHRKVRDERDELRAKIARMEQQEPVEWQTRTRPAWDDGTWRPWRKCSEEYAEDIKKTPLLHDWLYEARALYAIPGAQPAPSVPDGFSREDLEAVADGLDGYEKTVNVGNVTGEGDDHLESTTAYAARFIRTMLAATPEAKP